MVLFVDMKCSWGSTHHPIQDFAKHHVFSIQPRCLGRQDEELGPVGVWTSVGHAHLVGSHTGFSFITNVLNQVLVTNGWKCFIWVASVRTHPACSNMLQFEVLICKRCAIDAVACAENLIRMIITNFTPIHFQSLLKQQQTWQYLTSTSIPSCEISSLDHEILDDSVELCPLVAITFLWRWAEQV